MGSNLKRNKGVAPQKTVEIQGYTFASDLMVGRINQHNQPWTRRTVCQYNVEQVLYKHNTQHKTRDKKISEATKRGRWIEVKSAFHDLHDLRFKILYPTAFSTKHFIALCRYWEAQGLQPASVLQKVSKLTVFLSWVNKEQMVKDIAPNRRFLNPEKYKRQTATTRDKSWNEDTDFSEVFEKVSKSDKHVARQLKLSCLFGLRVKEAMRFKPFIDYDQDAQVIHVHRGTKGGHKRTIKITTNEQREYLEHLLTVMVDKYGSMTPRMADQAKWLKHYYYVTSKCGLSKKSNTNTHALRHAYAQSRYEIEAGVPAPIKQKESGIDIPEINPIADRIVQLMISQELGHQRESITTAYIG